MPARKAIRTCLRIVLASSLLFGGVLTASLLGGGQPASAQFVVTLYVTPTGSGNTCTGSSPCSSIVTAAAIATDGSYAGDDVTIDVTCGSSPYPVNNLIVDASSLHSLSITGLGPGPYCELSGGGIGRVLTIRNGTVNFNGLAIENGSAPNFLPVSLFLFDDSGGGIVNSGDLTLTDSLVSQNRSSLADGGGIFNVGGGDLTLIDSTVMDNVALGDGSRGGGIENYAGNVTVTDSTVSGNTADVYYGFGLGGGINNDHDTLTLTNSTVSSNNAGFGGGIGTSSSAIITDSTISGNTATYPGETGDGGIAGAVTIGASIVAGNAGGNCSVITSVSVGYNLTNDPSGTACGFTQPTDVVNADPKLGPLAGNGGPTETMPPYSDSPAVGVIPASPATTLNGIQVCPRTDQRHLMSASGASCTIGAAEFATISCPAGSYSASGHAPCTLAPPGSYVDTSGATFPTACEPGAFSASPGATSCTLAPPGSYVSTTEATSPTACPPGTYSSSPGATGCTLAPPNTYVDTYGATAPTSCPAGTANPNSGSTSAAACVALPFRISTTSLSSATRGFTYGPVTLQAAGAESSTSPYVTTLKWKKVFLPKGLKLSSAGVLSGTPNRHLVAGTSSVSVQVTETVTTLSSRNRPVKTKTTAQATIPLTIT